MATKVTAVLTDNSLDADDLISIVRRALLDAGCQVDSVDAHGIPGRAVLYIDFGVDQRKYVLAIPSRERRVEWTEDIDAAKVCATPASIEMCVKMVADRVGVKPEVMYV